MQAHICRSLALEIGKRHGDVNTRNAGSNLPNESPCDQTITVRKMVRQAMRGMRDKDGNPRRSTGHCDYQIWCQSVLS